MRNCTAAFLLVFGAAMLGGCGKPSPVFEELIPPELKQLYDKVGAAPDADSWVRIASVEVARRNWLDAEAAFQKALALQADHPGAVAGLASLKIAQGDKAAGARMVADLDEKHKDNAEAQTAVGELYMSLGQRDLAIASWGRAVDLNPRLGQALLRLCQAALGAEDLPGAKRYYRQLAEAFPKAGEVQQMRLQIAAAEHDNTTVEQILRQRYAAAATAGNRDALAGFLMRLGRFTESQAVIDQWMEDHPLKPKPPTDPAELEKWIALRRDGYILPKTLTAGIMRTSGREAEARRDMQKLLRSIETAEDRGEPPVEEVLEFEVRLIYAQCLFADNQPDVAVSEVNKARDLIPHDYARLLRVANTLADFEADTQLTLEIYQDIINNDASLREDTLRYETVFLQQVAARSEEEPAPALIDAIEKQYVALLQQKPSDVIVLNNLAWHLARYRSEDKPKMQVALGCIQQAIRLNGPNANLIDTLGYVLLQAGDLEAAEKQFRTALEVMPDNAELNYHLALVYERRGDRAAAARYAQKAVDAKTEFDGLLHAKELANASVWRGN